MTFEELDGQTRQRLADLNPEHVELLKPYVPSTPQRECGIEEHRRQVQVVKGLMQEGRWDVLRDPTAVLNAISA